MKDRAIGVFDTGVGGLTVVSELLRELPSESIVYFGDTARVPYGGKSAETIVRYSIESTIFLMEQNIKLLVIACNTVTAHAFDRLRQIFNIPIVAVIEPGADRAIQVTKNQRIAVLGTKATVQSGAYEKAIKRKLPNAHVVSIACPLLVPIVEERFISHPLAQLAVKEYLQPVHSHEVDTVLLGCTHYPLLRSVIENEVGEGVSLVDSASTCAERVRVTLSAQNLHVENSEIKPHHRYYVSDDPEKFKTLGQALLGIPIPHVDVRP